MTPLVSVLMSVRDGREFLAASLDSLGAQDLADWELVVIDDASSDHTPEILAAHAARDQRVRVVTNPVNLGLTKSLNRGLALCRGRYLARLDADDLARPDRLSRQVAFLEAHPEVGLLGGAVLPIDPDGRPLGPPHAQPVSDRAIRCQLLLTNPFYHPAVMLRRELLDRHGLAYDESLPQSQDYDLFSRMLGHTRGANLPEVVIDFRHHPGQVSKAKWADQQATALRVSRANLAAAGLGDLMDDATLHLARTAGHVGPTPLSAQERRAQFRGLRLVFAALAARGARSDPAWRALEAQWWRNLRRAARHWPRDRATLAVLWGASLADPAGAARDLVELAAKALTGRLPGVRP